MSQYPRDEFDKVPESAARQGVHRERLGSPRSSGLALKIFVGLLVLAVGLVAYFILPRLGIGEAAEPASATTAAPTPDEASTEPSDATSESPEATEGATPSASPSATPEPTGEGTEPAAAVDRAQPVTVLNGTTVSGLATTAAGRLQVDGWTVAEIGNWAGEPLLGSIVFYNGEEQRANAEALAALLGIPTVQGGSALSPNVTVVVGAGFQ
ncbi:LytR C-terminal domain-containing protein [Arthrobacter sp. H5]|uniref:LytR C-terminal domain-containing protein n=1 Tax=Arthrobacter sp. H5 TaxID=1267973 RepID=UPI000484CA8E|nr:LytR C-terminal domain-containing protein [Arthrobacter sp. H5]